MYSCSSNDDEGQSDNNPQSGGNNINFTVSNSAAANLNDAYNITYPDNDDQAATMIYGHVYNEDTDEGTIRVVSLTFAYFVSDNDYYDVSMTFPAGIGSHTLGEFQTSSTGMITEYPLSHMVLNFDAGRAFYDSDGDLDNDIMTDLLSKNVVVTVTEYEETTNSFGLLTLSHIKGTIGNSGNQFFHKAFTGPTTDPEELLCSVTADFEYNIQD